MQYHVEVRIDVMPAARPPPGAPSGAVTCGCNATVHASTGPGSMTLLISLSSTFHTYEYADAEGVKVVNRQIAGNTKKRAESSLPLHVHPASSPHTVARRSTKRGCECQAGKQ